MMKSQTEDIDILIVEDNPNDAELAMRAFKKNNLSNQVFVVEDGEEALDFVFSRNKFLSRKGLKKPKIILLDLKLPKVSGLEVLKEIKNNPDTRLIPVIVRTSSKEETDLILSYQLGVNSNIVKPVDFEKFVQAVRDLGLYWLLLNQYPQHYTADNQ